MTKVTASFSVTGSRPFRQMPDADQEVVRVGLDTVDGSGVLQLDPPRVKRIGLAAGRIA